MGNMKIAVARVRGIAEDNTWGYSQPRRDWAKEDDCSSGSLDSLKVAGYDIGSATYTGDAYEPLLAAGFQDVTTSVNLRTGAGLQEGDVLLRPKTKTLGGHMAIMVSANQLAQFQGDFDGKPGDSSGREITIKDYYDSPFLYVLRDPITVTTPTPPAGTLTHSIGEHVIFSTCYRSSVDGASAAIQASAMKQNHGIITKIYPGSRNPYLLNTDMCFVNDGDIRGPYGVPVVPPAVPKTIAVGTRYTLSGTGTSGSDGTGTQIIKSGMAKCVKIVPGAKNPYGMNWTSGNWVDAYFPASAIK